MASLFAVVVSGVCGVYLAYNGYNVWALVVQTLLNNLLNVGCLWILVKWLPIFSFSWESFKQLFFFGSKLLLAGVISSLYSQLYTIVIGKTFSTTNLGYYNRAFAIFPLMLGIVALAEPIVACLFTEKWLPIVPLLRILCLAYMWDPIMLMNSNFLAVKGRTDMQLKGELWKKMIAVVILLVTFLFGLEMVCWGLVVYSFVDIYIMTHFVRKVSCLSLMNELKSIMPIFALSVGTAIITWGSVELLWHSYLGKLIGGVIIGVITYVTFAGLFSFEEMDSVKNILGKK